MTQPQSAPFDLDGLNEMYGRETVQELLGMSLNEVSDLVRQIDEAIAGTDIKALLAAAHQLKGLASTMTINELAEICLQMETVAKQEDWQAIALVKEALRVEFTKFADYANSVLQATAKD